MSSGAVTTVAKISKPQKQANAKAKNLKPAKITTSKGKEVLVQPLHPTARLYGQVLVDPFSLSEGVAQPFGDPVKSSKEVYFAKGELQLGTTGYGFVLFKPTVANDYACISHTTATSVGTASTQLDAFTNTTQLYPVGCPYTQAMYGAGSTLVTRYVGGGIRAKYFGKILDKNGLCTAVEEPDGQTIESSNFTTLINTDYTRTRAIGDKEWDATINSSGPFHPDQYSFRGGVNGIAPMGEDFAMGLLFKGEPGDLFWFECKYYIEAAGKGPPAKSLTVPCLAQGQALHAASKSITGTKGTLAVADKESFWSKAKAFIGDNLPMIIEGTKALGATVFAAVTRNPQALGVAAQSIGNMISSSSGPLKLTATQQSILRAYPGAVTKDPHIIRNLTDTYVTPFSVMGQPYFNFEVVSLGEAGALDSGFYVMPIPKRERFLKVQEVLYPAGRENDMAYYMMVIHTRYVGNFGGVTTVQYNEALAAAQSLLDLKLNQTPPMSEVELENKCRLQAEETAVDELIPKIHLTGWFILRDEGETNFAAYVRMMFGPEAQKVVNTETFRSRSSEFASKSFLRKQVKSTGSS